MPSPLPESSELPAMLATLRCYDGVFGPRHVQTLALKAHIAQVLHSIGERGKALQLLECVVRDLDQSVVRTHATRLMALQALRILLVEESETTRAVAVQREIVECLTLAGSPDAATAR